MVLDMIKILAHRGFWQREEEKNSIGALKKAVDFLIKTDIYLLLWMEL